MTKDLDLSEWDAIPEKYNFIGFGVSGYVFVFATKPKKTLVGWLGGGENEFWPMLPYCDNWEMSLRERPKKV